MCMLTEKVALCTIQTHTLIGSHVSGSNAWNHALPPFVSGTASGPGSARQAVWGNDSFVASSM